MKKILILIFCISFFSAVYSQGVNENDENELYDRLTKCIIERDSLTKIDKVKTDSIA